MAFQKFDAHNDYILKCLVSDDLKYLATCSADKTVKLWVMIQDKGYVLHSTL
ncbi:MAG: WD40 repeat domain-containing protein, partial [bacterium]